MDISKIEAGNIARLNVFIECTKNSKNYYKYDENSETFILKKTLKQEFPGCYGFIPKTYHVDAQPLDALVLTTDPLEQEIIVKVKPIGVIRLKNEIPDYVLITVSLADKKYSKISSITKLSKESLKRIKLFLEELKGLEIERVFDVPRAKNTVRRAIELYKKKFG